MDVWLKMRKKGMVYEFALNIISVVILLTALLALMALRNEEQISLGERQIELLKSYHKGEDLMFKIDSSAETSSEQIIYDLAETGGLDWAECGMYLGYMQWNNEDKECWPDAENLFRKRFTNEFNRNLGLYKDESIMQYNHHILVNGTKVIGTAIEDIRVNLYMPHVWGDGTKSGVLSGWEMFKPSFNVDTGFDISIYQLLEEQSKEMIAECADAEPTPWACSSKKIIEFNIRNKDKGIEWNIGQGGKGAKKFFNDFVYAFEKCAESEDDNCLCYAPFSSGEGYEDKTFQIKIIKRGDATYFYDEEYAFGKAINVKAGHVPDQNPNNNLIGHEEMAYHAVYDENGNFHDSGLNYGQGTFFESLGKLLSIKPKNDLGAIFIYKKGDAQAYVPFDYVASSYASVPACELKEEHTIRFNVKKKGQKAIAYDSHDKKVDLRDVIIKFALYFPEGPAHYVQEYT